MIRLALALAAVLIASPAVADPIPSGLVVTQAYLSKDAMTNQTIGLVTIYNGSDRQISAMIVKCAAIGNDNSPEEVTGVGFNNIKIGETVYGQAIFENNIEGGSRITCRINTAS